MSKKNGDNKRWYREDAQDVLDAIDSSKDGLSEDEAKSRLKEHGPNTIRTEKKTSAWKVLLHQSKSPLIYVLIAALIITALIQRWDDVIVIALVLVINAVIGFTQEYRAESAVQSLMEMVSPKAKVRRGGEEREIDSDQLVPGDVVRVAQGDMIPADLRIIDAQGLQVDESAMTGESVPVPKTSEPMTDVEGDPPPSDQENMAFMGTAVTAGKARGVIVGTGPDTELGEIARGVREAGDIRTPLQQRMDRLAKWISGAILIVSVIAFAGGYFLLDRGFEDMLLLAISLAVAAIPEGLPIVMTVALAVGVRRMARRHAIIRHLPAVETLGSTSTIISDKTGTLTQNRMVVQQVYAGDRQYHITGKALSTTGEVHSDDDEKIDEIEDESPLYFTLLTGLLNNGAEVKKSDEGEKDADDQERDEDEAQDLSQEKNEQKDEESEDDEQEVGHDGELRPQGDPMEVALLVSAMKARMQPQEMRGRYKQVDEVPFQTERKFSATIHEAPDGEGPLVLIKGAPEVILKMSDRRLSDDGEEADLNRDELEQKNEELASQGLRMLAMAIGRGDEAAKSIKSDEPGGMIFVGMQGLLDPPRPEAVDAVDHCHRAGIRVMMVTGDHARTAAAIAHECHIYRPVSDHKDDDDHDDENRRRDDNNINKGDEELPEAHTGQEIEDLSDDDLDELLERSTVFARVKPNQKLRLVERLKAKNQIVAVTGDGVNDAPALKAAHLGCAMGESGTDVAKEASDMVITDDNFASVYSAVEEGRTSFRNIRMATFFLLSTGVADVLIILIALALDWPLPLLPAQILWVNVVTNGITDVALAFEPGDDALYRRPPRPISEGVLDRPLLERLVLIGVWFTLGTLGMFYWLYQVRGDNVEMARMAAVTTLVVFQLVHVFNCRSETISIFKKSLLSNKVLFIGALASLAVHIAAMYLPWTQQVLGFQPLPWHIWLIIVLIAATAIIINEVHKWLRRPGRNDAKRSS